MVVHLSHVLAELRVLKIGILLPASSVLSGNATRGPRLTGCDRHASLRVSSFASADCERSVGTVFQLPNPDAIYSRDEEKEWKVGRHLMFVFAHGPRAAEAR
jgi:hypothetical protein